MNRVRRAELAAATVALVANTSQPLLRARTGTSARALTNVGAVGAIVLIARDGGLTWNELGLSAERLRDGLRWGISAGAVAVAAIGAAGSVATLRPRFADERVASLSPGRARYEVAARIPFETALGEEVVFRGALLGLALRRRSTPAALATSSLLFGLWHLVPTWTGFEGSAIGAAAAGRSNGPAAAVAGVVAATTGAGMAFGALRLRSGSVLAPTIAHAALNMTSFAVSRRAARPAPAVGREVGARQ